MAVKYFEAGIKQNIICCKFLYLYSFDRDKENYIEEVSYCAKNGCRGALNVVYRHETDENKKKEWIKLGAKKGFDTYILKLIDYYENHNQFKFWRLLRESKNNINADVLLHVGKKYLQWNLASECMDTLYRGLQADYYECYDFLRTNLDTVYEKPEQLETMLKFLEKNKKDIIDELNLTLAYNLVGKWNNSKEILEKIKDEYYQNLGYFRYYYNMRKYDKSFEHLIKAYELNKEKFSGYADLGVMYFRNGQNEKALKI